jgi:hypothetical protein
VQLRVRACSVLVALTVAFAAATSREPWSARGDEIQAAYATYTSELDRLYASLADALKTDAPDLYAKIKAAEPKAIVTGYQVLPKLLPETPLPKDPPRAVLSRYNWSWAGTMIEREMKKLAPLEADLGRAGQLPPGEKRAVYETLAAAFPPLPKLQRSIDTYVKYNQLWQPSIAANRVLYDRQTLLKDAVLERQTIRDRLAAARDASWTAEKEADLHRREAALSVTIHAATDEIVPLTFLHVEHPSAHRFIVHVPFETDIQDDKFLHAFRSAVEGTWRVVDGEDEYRVVVSMKRLSPHWLYRNTATGPPKPGAAVDLATHVALFPAGAAVLTTGAVTTHVNFARAIVIGPNDLAPHDLAHEFGHILGFKDVYFRGYKDLGADGFEIEEIVAETGDIMGGRGPVRKEQFERLIEAIARTTRPSQPVGFER